MSDLKFEGLIAPRESWLPQFQKLTDEQAEKLHRQILTKAANISGIDEALAEGDEVYRELIEMINSGLLGSP